MANIFCITYGGRASNGNTYVPYKAIAKTADEAIEKARKLAGICRALIDDDICQKIRELEVGETLKVKRSSLKFTLHVRRTVR